VFLFVLPQNFGSHVAILLNVIPAFLLFILVLTKEFIMATITGTRYNDNNTYNGIPYIFRPSLHGTESNDHIEGSQPALANFDGHDIIYGYGGIDYLYGYAGNDRIYGGKGNDFIYGTYGHDVLHGGEGDDWIDGWTENDYIYGEAGHDILYSGHGDDYIYGGEGNDWLYGLEGNDRAYGQGGNDHLYGTYGYDVLYGGEGNDWADGWTENDSIYGEGGNDSLEGGNGNDWLNGGSGQDKLHGEAGADTFDYNAASESTLLAPDTIYDFSGTGREGDKIDLSGIDANLYAAGNQAFHTSQLSYSNGTLTANIYGTAADLQIVLSGAPQLSIAGGDVVL
jgi:Ca2+-binding RTX toxin-like protein